MVLENSEKEEIVLRDDLNALEWYMQLEQMRTATKFQYQIDVAENINKDETLIPPLFYSLLLKTASGTVFKIQPSPDIFKFLFPLLIINFYVLLKIMDPEEYNLQLLPKTKKSMSTNITQERINLINKTNQTNYSLNYTDLPQGLKWT
ncbi:MAG: hypothetical protein IPK08_19495 [Bacteroidetes bacterium]|nr:hypothetical protein [Bacteroidota bacterium]